MLQGILVYLKKLQYNGLVRLNPSKTWTSFLIWEGDELIVKFNWKLLVINPRPSFVKYTEVHAVYFISLFIICIFGNYIRTVPHSAHPHLLHSHSQFHIQHILVPHFESHIQHIIHTFICLFILCIFRNFIRTIPHSAHLHLLHSHFQSHILIRTFSTSCALSSPYLSSVYFEFLLEQSHIQHILTSCIHTLSPTFSTLSPTFSTSFALSSPYLSSVYFEILLEQSHIQHILTSCIRTAFRQYHHPLGASAVMKRRIYHVVMTTTSTEWNLVCFAKVFICDIHVINNF